MAARWRAPTATPAGGNLRARAGIDRLGGPAGAALYKGIPGLLLGVLIQNPISFAYTSSDREPVNALSVQPVLLAIGPKVTYIGPSGLAVQMKLAINLVLMVEVIAFGEGIALAEKGGVPREVAVEALLNSVAASPVLGYRVSLRRATATTWNTQYTLTTAYTFSGLTAGTRYEVGVVAHNRAGVSAPAIVTASTR